MSFNWFTQYPNGLYPRRTELTFITRGILTFDHHLFISDAAPVMTYRFIDQTLQPGPPVSLKCSARGSPTPEIKWTLNGFPLPRSER